MEEEKNVLTQKKGMEMSSKSLLITKRLIIAITIISIIGTVIFAFVSRSKIGAIGVVVGIFSSVVFYMLAKFVLWLAYDIKLIRNKLYDLDEDDKLDKFVNDF